MTPEQFDVLIGTLKAIDHTLSWGLWYIALWLFGGMWK